MRISYKLKDSGVKEDIENLEAIKEALMNRFEMHGLTRKIEF